MIDVAIRSGVSHQTVSRVLNNHKNVSVKTRNKVLAAMHEMGYTPNLAARALVTGRTGTIGVLSYDTTLFGPASTLHAVQSAAREVGYGVKLVSLKAIDPELVLSGINELRNGGVDGVIIIAPQLKNRPTLDKISKTLPVVIVEADDSVRIPSVNIDQFFGATIAVEHLINLGHKKIAHISGPLDWYEAQRRFDGWKDTLRKAKLPANRSAQGDWSPQSGYLATKQLMAQDKAVTAIFAGNDAIALGALKALSELRIKVPEEMSIVGFDDVPEAQFLVPGLTTVRQDFDAVGKDSLELLLKKIAKEKLASHRIAIRPELIIRESTASPRR